MDWYFLAIGALFCYGIQNFLYKVSAEKRCNSAWTSFSFMLTVAILSSTLFLILRESVSDISLLLLIAFVNAVAFLTTILSRMESLKHIPTSVAYPIMRMKTVIVVIFGILYFKDSLSVYQIFGIALALSVVWILSKSNQNDKSSDKNFGFGIFLAIIALLVGAVTTIIVKFAAISVNALGFIAVSYIYNTILSFGLRRKLQSKRENPVHTNAVKIGFLIGLFNFVGFYMLLKAYSIGPLSLIAPLISLSFLIAITLSALIYKEKITRRRVVGIILSIIAIGLLRI